MRKKGILRNEYLILILCIPAATLLNAQDTLMIREQGRIAAKVDEITLKQIKYRRWDNLEGPQYIKSKNEIEWIRYKNGTEERFPAVLDEPSYLLSTDTLQRMSVFGTRLYYGRKPLSQKVLTSLVSSYPEERTRKALHATHLEMNYYKDKQFSAGTFGPIGAILVPFIVLVVSLDQAREPAPFVFGGLAAGGVIAVISRKKYKRNKEARLNKIAEFVHLFNSPLPENFK